MHIGYVVWLCGDCLGEILYASDLIACDTCIAIKGATTTGYDSSRV